MGTIIFHNLFPFLPLGRKSTDNIGIITLTRLQVKLQIYLDLFAIRGVT